MIYGGLKCFTWYIIWWIELGLKTYNIRWNMLYILHIIYGMIVDCNDSCNNREVLFDVNILTFGVEIKSRDMMVEALRFGWWLMIWNRRLVRFFDHPTIVIKCGLSSVNSQGGIHWCSVLWCFNRGTILAVDLFDEWLRFNTEFNW